MNHLKKARFLLLGTLFPPYCTHSLSLGSSDCYPAVTSSVKPSLAALFKVSTLPHHTPTTQYSLNPSLTMHLFFFTARITILYTYILYTIHFIYLIYYLFPNPIRTSFLCRHGFLSVVILAFYLLLYIIST